MGLWRDLLRRLGLTNDARVHISAPGVDVTITGSPDQVRHLLGIVKYELERSLRWQDRESKPPPSSPAPERAPAKQLSPSRSGQYVQPSELDEMDSPYAFGARVVPVEDETDDGEKDVKNAGLRFSSEPTTLVPDERESVFAPEPSNDGIDGPRERDVTRVAGLPRAPSVVAAELLSSAAPRVTSSSSDLRALALLVRNSAENDPDDSTKEVTRDS